MKIIFNWRDNKSFCRFVRNENITIKAEEMTEIQKTIAILKIRWPEVTLIVGLYTLVELSHSLFGFAEPDVTKTSFLPSILFILSLTVVSMLLTYGFLRTVHLEGPKEQTPMDLLKTGKHFFWRMVGFGFIFAGLYFILTGLIFSITKYFTSTNTGFIESATSAPWLYQLCSTATMLIMIKVSLFVPALILVLDCRVVNSFKLLSKFKLFKSKELVALFCLSTVIHLLWLLLKIPENPETISQYILKIGTIVTGQVLGLIVVVTAVRFVSSLDLGYDGRITDSNSGDLLKYPTED
ncbi:MAG: hypothetical protein FVQ84_10310 [Planctomycetes bacterium]|nr:hypothetical protein [Planctomycetota bacterium]